MSKTNAPDDHSVICNDGSERVVKPGATPQCSTGTQIAAREAKMQQDNATRYQDDVTQLATWRDQFVPI